MSNKDQETKDLQKIVAEPFGARVGFALISISCIVLVIYLAISVLCPHTYDRLKAIFTTDY